MKKFFLLVFIIFFASCNRNSETVKGDLYFTFENLIPENGFSEKKADEMEKLLDVVNISEQKNQDVKATFEYLEKLKKHKLLRNPSIKLRFSGKDMKTISLDPKEYKKLQMYNPGYLNRLNSKIEVELQVITLEKGLYYSGKIISIKEVPGKTYFIR